MLYMVYEQTSAVAAWRVLTAPAVAQMTWPTALASPWMMVPEYTCSDMKHVTIEHLIAPVWPPEVRQISNISALAVAQ